MSNSISFFDKRYVIQEQLGLGGMGAVYKAVDKLNGETLALKRVFAPVESLVFTSMSGNEDLRLALAQEFQTLASLRHPNIISVLDYGFDSDQQPYFTMELMQDARSLVGASRFKENETKVDYIIQMLQALNYLYHRGIIHRDLKPGNVLVADDHVKILDFGLAISGREIPEEAVGTVSYMAPELLEERAPSIASDLFAVGIMIYELFAGEHPFDPTGSIMEMVYRISMHEPDYSKLQNVPPQLIAVLEKLLAKNPHDRYQDATSVIIDLCAAFKIDVPEETEDIRESFLQAADFVGRDKELSQLEASLQDLIQDGKGSAWLIGGESGVGKSRLVDEIRVRAMINGVEVFHAETEANHALPYQLWRQPIRRMAIATNLETQQADILRQIVPDIHQLVDIAPGDTTLTGRQAIQDTIFGVLNSQSYPMVLILEDLHWASESLDVLRRLVRHIESVPIMVVGNYRNDERPTLPDHLPNMNHLLLERLQREEIAELAESMLGENAQDSGLIRFLEDQTEGNLFFLVEVVRTLAEEAGRLDLVGKKTLPMQVFTGGMQSIVKRRLDQIPEWGQSLLHYAAVMGREIDVKLLNVIRQNVAEDVSLNRWLLSCANAAIIEVREGDWRFVHDKLREGVQLSINPNEIPQINRLVAEAIETAYDDPTDYASRLAELWGMAGEKEKQWHYAYIAANKYVEISIYPDAIRQFKTLLSLVDDLDREAERPNILVQLGRAHRYMSEYDEATNYLEKGFKLAEADGNKKIQAEALRQLGSIKRNQGLYQAGLEQFLQALSLMRDVEDKVMESLLLSNLGDIALALDNLNDARDFHQQALSLAREQTDIWLEGISLDNLGRVYSQLGQADRSIEYAKDAIKLFEASGNKRSEGIAYGNLGASYHALGNYDEAFENYQQALKIMRHIGDTAGEGISLDNISDAYHDLGNYEKSIEFSLVSLEISRRINNQRNASNRLYDMCKSYLGLNQTENAITNGEAALDIAMEMGDTGLQALYSNLLGWALMSSGRLSQARMTLQRAADLDVNEHAYRVNAALGVVAARQGEPDEAQTLFEQAIEKAELHLATDEHNYRPWFVIGLAESGLALLSDAQFDDKDLSKAMAAYEKGLEIVNHKGIRDAKLRELSQLKLSRLGNLSAVMEILKDNDSNAT